MEGVGVMKDDEVNLGNVVYYEEIKRKLNRRRI